MAKPYSDLEKQALAIIRGGGDPALSKDKALANYWEWRMNPASSTHNLPESSSRSTGRQLNTIILKPFATLPVATLFAKETISARALAAATAKTLDNFGIAALTAGAEALFLGRFKPAKVYWRTGASSEASQRTSRITKRGYKSKYKETDQGYSVPLGKGTGGTNLLARQTAIRTVLTTGQAVTPLITFTPEVFNG